MDQQTHETLTQENVSKKWYKTVWGIIFIILFWPFMLFWYMWAKTKWNIWIKIFITLVLFVAVIANSGDNKSEIKNEQMLPQEKSEVANLQEEENFSSQKTIKEKEAVNIEEKDFSVYDEFLNLRESQLKNLDRIISNKTIFSKENVTVEQQLTKILKPTETREYLELQQIQDNFYEFEKKLDANNPLHQIILESIDFYTSGSIKSYQNLLLYSDAEEMKFAEEERKRGDKKVEELSALLKQQGYERATVVTNAGKQQTQSSKTKGYEQLFSFSGEGAKNSETFTITGSKFRIKYACVETTMTPLCQAVLRSPNDESLYKEIFNTIGETKSETIFYEKGTFYIEATVMGGEFDVIIEEYK